MQKGLVKRRAVLAWVQVNGLQQDGPEPCARLVRLAKRCYVSSARSANSNATSGTASRADAQECQLAGRFLRRLPVLAHARYIAPKQVPGGTHRRSLRTWVDAMERLVEDEQSSRERIKMADGHREKQEIGTDVLVKQQ